MSRRRIPRIERILRRINRLLPTLQQPVAQHSFNESSCHLRQLQELRQRQWPALRFQQFPHAFFSALPQRTLRLGVIFLFVFLLHQFLSRRTALPRDHSLRPSVSSLHGLPNFNESEALQSPQSWSVNTQSCRWAQRPGSLFLFQLCKKRRLSGREPMRQFTAAQALRRFTPRIRQNNLALRFHLCYRRQHRTEHFAGRRQVIPCDPLRQLDPLRRQRRNKIQYAGDLSNFRPVRRALRQFHDDAEHHLLPERHEHAAPRLHRSLQCFRDRIRERSEE